MEHIDTIKWAVLFSDIKNFTLKTSLLTNMQIEKLLNKQDEIVLPIVKKYSWEIVKVMWDSYMIIFKDAENSINASIQIQKELDKYNKKIDLNLYTLELRISIDFWKLEREFTLNGEDYFWETVNISSRLQNKTPENKIYVTGNLISEIRKDGDFYYRYLWKTSFKWVLYQVDIYDLAFKTIEINKIKKWKNKEENINEILLTNDFKDKIKNIDESIFKYSSVAAILWIQPIPFIDGYSVVPLHLYMLKEISNSYWIKISTEESKEVLTTLLWSIWWSYILSQWIVWISKVWLLWIWWYVMIPLNFALTFSIWKILSYYFYKKSQWVKATNNELKELFKYSIKSGKGIAKKEKNEIIKTWKQYKSIITWKVSDIKWKSESKVKSIINKIKNH